MGNRAGYRCFAGRIVGISSPIEDIAANGAVLVERDAVDPVTLPLVVGSWSTIDVAAVLPWMLPPVMVNVPPTTRLTAEPEPRPEQAV